MAIEIVKYTKDRFSDVIDFELELRRQEPDTYFWDIDETYKKNVLASFDDKRFTESSVSLLAYKFNKVIGRIDASIMYSHFDGTIYEAYLNWICVLKEERHNKVAQKLLSALKKELKEQGIEQLVLLTASNEESSNFYNNCDDIKFERGATIKIK